MPYWQAKEIGRVMRLHEAGVDLGKIAQSVGRPKNAVIGLIYRKTGRRDHVEKRRIYPGWTLSFEGQDIDELTLKRERLSGYVPLPMTYVPRSA